MRESYRLSERKKEARKKPSSSSVIRKLPANICEKKRERGEKRVGKEMRQEEERREEEKGDNKP